MVRACSADLPRPLEIALAQHHRPAEASEPIGMVGRSLLDRVGRLLGDLELPAHQGQGTQLRLCRHEAVLFRRRRLVGGIGLRQPLAALVDQAGGVECLGVLRIEPQHVAQLDHRLGVVALLVELLAAGEVLGLLPRGSCVRIGLID